MLRCSIFGIYFALCFLRFLNLYFGIWHYLGKILSYSFEVFLLFFSLAFPVLKLLLYHIHFVVVPLFLDNLFVCLSVLLFSLFSLYFLVWGFLEGDILKLKDSFYVFFLEFWSLSTFIDYLFFLILSPLSMSVFSMLIIVTYVINIEVWFWCLLCLSNCVWVCFLPVSIFLNFFLDSCTLGTRQMELL